MFRWAVRTNLPNYLPFPSKTAVWQDDIKEIEDDSQVCTPDCLTRDTDLWLTKKLPFLGEKLYKENPRAEGKKPWLLREFPKPCS